MTNETVVTMKDEQPMLTMMRGKTTFLIGMHFNEKGKETVEEKLKNIMIKDLIAKDNENGSLKTAEKVDFQGLEALNESSKKSTKMA